MSGHGHDDLTGEMPRSHDLQMFLMMVFFIVWIADSFLLRISTPPLSLQLVLLPLVPSLLVLGIAVYFMRQSHGDLFDTSPEGLATGGVFGRVRHPMYFGTVLFYLGLVMITVSVSSLLFWLVIAGFYNMLANYEERLLADRFGEEFFEYRKEVRKWIPR